MDCTSAYWGTHVLPVRQRDDRRGGSTLFVVLRFFWHAYFKRCYVEACCSVWKDLRRDEGARGSSCGGEGSGRGNTQQLRYTTRHQIQRREGSRHRDGREGRADDQGHS